ncbi:MAG: sigma-70 family RNA polymerase sigma factor [Phycisphaerales bacterium]|nr:sigma-70 family RNA polymerase sigma factor [Phycisphaerales bacterium]
MSGEQSSLLDRAARGEPEALRALLEKHGGQVWAEINADIGAQWRAVIDADDVMQVTYLEAFLQIDKLEARDDGAFVGWLRRIAKNNLRDAVKEQGRKKRPQPNMRMHALGGDSYITLVEHLGETTTTPSRHVAADEAARYINAALDRLPEDYATVVRQYDLEGRSIADVAAGLKRSTGAVHMLRARAHDRLRNILGRETDFFSVSP